MRTFIVDDEPLARDALRAALGRHPDFEIVGEFPDGPSAAAAIVEQRPDVVLLDVQMPGLDGFGVLERVGFDAIPAVVFVTAHDEYAVRAFDAYAVDYLLKPFSDERLARALDRVRARRDQANAASVAQNLAELVRMYRGGSAAPATRKRLLAREGERVVFVPVDDIEWFEADGNRVRIHTGEGCFTMRATLSGTLQELDPARFVRAHRSVVVNLDRVRELRAWAGGDAVAVLRSGAQVKVSRHYREQLLRRAR